LTFTGALVVEDVAVDEPALLFVLTGTAEVDEVLSVEFPQDANPSVKTATNNSAKSFLSFICKSSKI
jgi:hypothetical protein